MTESEPGVDPEGTDANDASRKRAEPTPFWHSPAFAAVAALIALMASVWRCA